MAIKWNAGMDQRLLLLLISMISLNWSQVANRWAEVYGNSVENQPTKKAIIEHISKLRKSMGVPANKCATTATTSLKAASSSSSAPSSSRVSKDKARKASGYKGKGKQKVVDSDSDDVEPAASPARKRVKKEEDDGSDEENPRLFGEITPPRRPSLPGSARPEPGVSDDADFITADYQDFILHDCCDSDATIMNTSSDFGSPLSFTQSSSYRAQAPGDTIENTSPTPAPGSGTTDQATVDAIEDVDDCIVVRTRPMKKR